MILWCLLSVVIKSDTSSIGKEQVETAAKGRLIREVGTKYEIDFSEYANSKYYIGTYYDVLVDKDNCTEEKKK